MQHRQSAQSDDDPHLPCAEDPVPRYVAPREAPRIAGMAAHEVQRRAGLPRKLDRTAALWFLAYDAYDVHRSFFAGVRQVPLRNVLDRDERGIGIRDSTAPSRLHVDVRTAAGRLRTVIDDAVRRAVEGATRVGILLSGGLDSSAVTAAAHHVWRSAGRDPADLRLYHVLPPTGPAEVDHARAVAAHLGLVLVEVEPADDEADDAELLAALDAPTAGAGAPPALAALQRAAADGVELVLTGDGGDEAVAAYGTPDERGVGSAWAARVRTLLGGVLETARYRLGPWAPEALRRRRRTPLPPWLSEQVKGLGRPRELPPARVGLRGVAAARDRSLRAARQGLLVAWWRTAAARVGMQAAAPLLHASVMDLVTALPPWVFATGDRPKDLLRRAVGARLPETQRLRPKDQPYVEPWWRARLSARAAEWTEHYLVGGTLEQVRLIPPTVARTALAAAETAPADELYRALAMLGLERWWRAQREQTSPVGSNCAEARDRGTRL